MHGCLVVKIPCTDGPWNLPQTKGMGGGGLEAFVLQSGF